jgi:hypothetical protein
METEDVLAPPKRPLNAIARVVRRGRIFARLREGWAYDEIAREEGLSAERVRQIVREALERGCRTRTPTTPSSSSNALGWRCGLRPPRSRRATSPRSRRT